MWSQEFSSPNGEHIITLAIFKAVELNPRDHYLYFRLCIDGLELTDRIFGGHCLWSPDSSLACVVEWFTTDYSTKRTSLLVLRAEDRMQYSFPVLEDALPTPLSFVDDSLVLRHRDEFYGGGYWKADRETDLSVIIEWTPLTPNL